MDGYGLFDSVHDQLIGLIAAGCKTLDKICDDNRCLHPAYTHGDSGARICLIPECPCCTLRGLAPLAAHDHSRMTNWVAVNKR